MLSKMVKSIYNTILSDIVTNLETISGYYWAFYNTIKAIEKKERQEAEKYLNKLREIENRMLTGDGDVEIDNLVFKISQIRRSPIIVMGPPGVGKSETIQSFANQYYLDKNYFTSEEDIQKVLDKSLIIKEKFRNEISRIITAYVIGKVMKNKKELPSYIVDFKKYMSELELRVLTTTLSQLKQWQLAGIVMAKDIGYELEETTIDREKVAYTITQNARPDPMIVPNFYPTQADKLIKRPVYWLWFLDELVNTFPENMPLINQLLVEGQIANNSLCPNLTIVSAGNPLVHSSLARELPEPILNRLSFVYIGNYNANVRLLSIQGSIENITLPDVDIKTIYANTHHEYNSFIIEWLLWLRNLIKKEEENIKEIQIGEVVDFDKNKDFDEPMATASEKQQIFKGVVAYTKEFIENLKHLLLTLPNEFQLVNPKIEIEDGSTNLEDLIHDDTGLEIKYYSATYILAKNLIINRIKNEIKKNTILQEIEKIEEEKAKKGVKKSDNYGLETYFANIATALSYKNIDILMRGSKAPFSSGRAWYIAMKRAISIVEQINEKKDENYYKEIIVDIYRILTEKPDIKSDMLRDFYEKSIVYKEFGYNLMELAGTVGSLAGIPYGLYIIVRSIEDNLSEEKKKSHDDIINEIKIRKETELETQEENEKENENKQTNPTSKKDYDVSF